MENGMTVGQAAVYYGKEIFGDKFKLDDEKMREAYYSLYLYFTDKPGKYDPKKSIIISGTIGSGKTAVLKVYQQIFHRYKIVDAETIEMDLKKEGEIYTIEKYGYNYRKDLVIDDIGSEKKEVNLYKNSVSIIGLILKQRYKLFIEEGIKTHATTNLSRDELKVFYNDQNFDRLKESSNLIAWPITKSLR